MAVTARHLEFAPPPTPGLVRALVLAILAHAVLLAVLTMGVQWKREVPQQTFEAELWSALPVEAAPPAPELPPEPTPEPPKPVPPAPKPEPKPDPGPTPAEIKAQADIALMKEKEKAKQLKEKKLALEKAELEKLKLAEAEKEKKKLAELEKEKEKKKLAELEKQKLAKQEQDKKDKADKLKKAQADKSDKQSKQDAAEAKQIEELRKATIKRNASLAGGDSGNPNAQGKAAQSTGPSASYLGRLAARVKPNIVFAEEVTGNPAVEVDVRTSPSGNILSARVTKSSGVKAWDDAVLRAIEKTEVLPRDADGTIPSLIPFSFRPKD